VPVQHAYNTVWTADQTLNKGGLGDNMQYVPRDLREGDELHFGASTRRYTLKRRPSSNDDRSRKRSVSWPDEADAAGVLCLYVWVASSTTSL
jgi:hypothetical protein